MVIVGYNRHCSKDLPIAKLLPGVALELERRFPPHWGRSVHHMGQPFPDNRWRGMDYMGRGGATRCAGGDHEFCLL
jgi:hypothetical protein